jgi:hypothetical protein
MTGWTLSLIVACLLVASSTCSFGQQLDEYPDSALTLTQWKQRVEEARHRAEQFAANARGHAESSPPSEWKEAEIAGQRALHDPSLQRGDIIATNRGFVVFVGRENDNYSGRFLPAPDPRLP